MDHNAHRNGIENTGTREYERAIERSQHERMDRGNSGYRFIDLNNDNLHKTVEGVKDVE